MAVSNSDSVKEPEVSVSKLLYKLAAISSVTSSGRAATNSSCVTAPSPSASILSYISDVDSIAVLPASDNWNVSPSELLATTPAREFVAAGDELPAFRPLFTLL